MNDYISAADPLTRERAVAVCSVTVRIGKNSKTIHFTSLGDAFKALEGMEPSDIDGFTVDIDRSQLVPAERHAWPWQT